MNRIMINLDSQKACEILNDTKKVIITTQAPKRNYPIACYIYCNKHRPYLIRDVITQKFFTIFSNEKNDKYLRSCSCNEKVVARFVLNTISVFQCIKKAPCCYDFIDEDGKSDRWRKYVKDNNLNEKEVIEQALSNGKSGHKIYVWEIDELEVYGSPNELETYGVFSSPSSYFIHLDE